MKLVNMRVTSSLPRIGPGHIDSGIGMEEEASWRSDELPSTSSIAGLQAIPLVVRGKPRRDGDASAHMRFRLWKTVRVEWFNVPRYGTGEVREPRVHQLIRQKGQIEDRTFEIEFLDRRSGS